MALDDLWEARLGAAFFDRDVHELARDLLGRDLCRFDGADLRVGRIVEVEAYGGQPDPACHGDSGIPTDRTRPMFGPPGHAYVYLIYGMYDCFNVVSAPTGTAAAVLVRAAEPVSGMAAMRRSRGNRRDRDLMSGPGKLCQALDIRHDQHSGRGLDARELFLSSGSSVPDQFVSTTPRIGLNPKTVGDASEWPWRYVDERSDCLSR